MKSLRIFLGLALVQLGLVAAYLAVEGLRAASASPFSWERLDLAAPPLTVERAGEPHEVPADALVHFWATWCAPCQDELPALIAAADASGVPLLAITDESWPRLEQYFDGAVPLAVVRDPTGDAATRWEVSGLPDTFVVREGRVVGRVGGPRDWESTEARRFLATLEAP